MKNAIIILSFHKTYKRVNLEGNVLRELYVCDSVFQIMNVLNIVWHKHDSAERTMFVINDFKKAGDVANKVKQANLFDSVYLIPPSEITLMPLGIKRYILTIVNYLMPLRFIKNTFKGYKDVKAETFINAFDVIYGVSISRIAAAVLKLNPDAEFVLYDDGTGSYRGNIMNMTRIKRKLILSCKMWFCKIFGVGLYVRKPSKLLVNNVKMCRSTSVPSDRIFPIPKIDDGFRELCRKVFDVNTEWKNSVLWLAQPAKHIGLEDDIVKKVRSYLLPYKDRITVRMHPRDTDYEFYRDFDLDDGRCGWELLVMNAGEKANDLVLIGGFSTAQITPKFLFDVEPVLIFLYNFYKTGIIEKQKNSITQMIEDLRKAYRNPEKIYDPKTPEELSAILQKIFS